MHKFESTKIYLESYRQNLTEETFLTKTVKYTSPQTYMGEDRNVKK